MTALRTALQLTGLQEPAMAEDQEKKKDKFRTLSGLELYGPEDLAALDYPLAPE